MELYKTILTLVSWLQIFHLFWSTSCLKLRPTKTKDSKQVFSVIAFTAFYDSFVISTSSSLVQW